MKIVGPFLSAEDPDVFFFMRGFPDLVMPTNVERRRAACHISERCSIRIEMSEPAKLSHSAAQAEKRYVLLAKQK